MATTLKQYINNPSGVKTSSATNRRMYEELYQGKWGPIMTRENGHIEYKLYREKNIYVAYLKIPSEVIDKFYYDVVFKFTLKDSVKSLEDTNIEFFSNDPAFNYTWAHVFNKKGLTIKELEGKMSKVALKHPPKETNPNKVIGYVKSLFFAYLYLKQKGLLNRLRFEGEATKLDWKLLNRMITDTEEKVRDRQEAQIEYDKKKKKEKRQELDTTVRRNEIRSGISPTGFVKKVGLINRTKSITGTINKSKKIKKRR